MSAFVLMCVVYLVVLNVVCFLSIGVCLCSGCDGCCVFCLICDACSLKCSWSGSIFVSSCRYCVVSSCVLCSAGSGVNNVQVVLTESSMRLLYFIHMCICCKYGSVYALAAFLPVCVDVW